jgi:hypothetical protein
MKGKFKNDEIFVLEIPDSYPWYLFSAKMLKL